MSGSRLNYDKKLRDSKTQKPSSIIDISRQRTINEILKDMDHDKNFDREMYDKGTEYYEMGGKIEDLKDEYKNNRFFMSGYRRGQRLAYVKVVEEKYKKR